MRHVWTSGASLLILAAAVRAAAQDPLPAQPDPFAPLPAGAQIGPQGQVTGPGLVPGPGTKNAAVIPPLDAEVVWQQMV
ncbi:MAG: hypothetical protein ACKOB1_11540, partial [Planctomycetia bacterium]